MDTNEEFRRNAYIEALMVPLFTVSCEILECDSPLVPDADDLIRCENCKKRVCDVHSVKRSVYSLCRDCNRIEKAKLEAVALPELVWMVTRVSAGSITAEELDAKLSSLLFTVTDIEGGE